MFPVQNNGMLASVVMASVEWVGLAAPFHASWLHWDALMCDVVYTGTWAQFCQDLDTT